MLKIRKKASESQQVINIFIFISESIQPLQEHHHVACLKRNQL